MMKGQRMQFTFLVNLNKFQDAFPRIDGVGNGNSEFSSILTE